FVTTGSGAGGWSPIVTSGGTGSSLARDLDSTQFGDKYIKESTPSGWDLTGISCTATGLGSYAIGTGTSSSDFANGNGGTGFGSGDTTVKATLGAGDTVSCTFTNTKHATLTINKTSVGGDGSFPFVTTGSGAGGWSPIVTSGGTGSSLARDLDSTQFGDKYIKESTPSGWDLTGISCTATGLGSYAIGTGTSSSDFANGNGGTGFGSGDTTVKATLGAG